MSTPSPQELDAFEKQCDAWFAENTVRDPGFMLPLTFMEVSTDQQFDFLRDWQRKVYEAGFFGMSWPTEYGGYGLHPQQNLVYRYQTPLFLQIYTVKCFVQVQR